jgi:hypothetical protein
MYKKSRCLFGKTRAFIMTLALLAPVGAGSALAQSGGTAACVCYCGVSLRPPCGDDACKRACGWKPPSTGTVPGGAAGAMGGAISSGITNSINQSRERAEQERQRALEQGRQMMQNLDAMSEENARQGEELSRSTAEREWQLDNQDRQEALSTLKGTQNSGEIALKPSTDFFGIPGNPQNASSVVDLSRAEPDKPIQVDPNALRGGEQNRGGNRVMDCEQGRKTRDRLARGLPVQQEGIKRSAAQVEAAGKDAGAAKAETRRILLQGAVQEAKTYAQDVLTSVKALRAQIETLQGLDKAKRDLLIRSVNAVAFGGEDLYQAGRGGLGAGVEIQIKAQNLSGRVTALADKLLMETGIAEKVGEELSGKLWGPLGEFGFRGAKLSIDLSAAVGSGIISEADRQTAQRNLDAMRAQYEQTRQRIAELDQDLAELCKTTAQARP